jgi:hypothetical protein
LESWLLVLINETNGLMAARKKHGFVFHIGSSFFKQWKKE